MANLSKDDVLKLAALARLHLSEDEVTKFQTEINEILGYVETLQKVDVEGLEPTIQVGELKNVTRPDEIKEYQATQDDLLEIAPDIEGTSIKVKRVL